jgi:hypothetical protein
MIVLEKNFAITEIDFDVSQMVAVEKMLAGS